MLKLPIVISLVLSSLAVSADRPEQMHYKPSTCSVKKTSSADPRVVRIILETQPKLGVKYARRLAIPITRYSKQQKFPVEVAAAVAYTESRFRMVEKPCVGIMQLNTRVLRTNLNPRKLDDNVRLGISKLAWHYHRSLGSRGARTIYTLRRYKGGSHTNRYVKKVLKVAEHMRGLK